MTMQVSKRTVLNARKPDLAESRDGRHLLVWGDLAQWMVVDAELAAFLELFDGRLTLKDVIREHAHRQRKPAHAVEAAAMQAAAELAGRGILCETLAPAASQPETVRIANVTINLTNRCNLRCGWCYNADRATYEMPIERLMDAIERGRNVLAPDASFIILGGEPFVQLDRLVAALERAERIFTQPTLVSTNGTLLTDAAVERLARRRVNVQVSLDGPDAAHNDPRRGAGVFDTAREGIRRLVRAKIPNVLSMAFDRQSAADFEDYLDLALELGVDEARFIPMRRIGRGAGHAQSAPNLADAFERLLEILDRRPELRRLLGRDYFSIAMAVCRTSDRRTGCGIGRKVVFIDADGKVYPCPNHLGEKNLCGDLNRDGLAWIVTESPAMKSTRATYQVRRYGRCRDCALRHWCAGDCRGETVAVTGDPLAPSPHCAEHKKMIRRMLWLIADGDRRLGMSRQLRDGKNAVDAFSV